MVTRDSIHNYLPVLVQPFTVLVKIRVRIFLLDLKDICNINKNKLS